VWLNHIAARAARAALHPLPPRVPSPIVEDFEDLEVRAVRAVPQRAERAVVPRGLLLLVPHPQLSLASLGMAPGATIGQEAAGQGAASPPPRQEVATALRQEAAGLGMTVLPSRKKKKLKLLL